MRSTTLLDDPNMIFVFLLTVFLLSFPIQSTSQVIPVGYSKSLGVQLSDFTSAYLNPIEVDVEKFQPWPAHWTGPNYCTFVGTFDKYLGLNTTEESVAYFVTDDLPARDAMEYNWFRISPQLADLSPVVKHLSNLNPDFNERVFISDETPECRQLFEEASGSFKWNVFETSDLLKTKNEIYKLKVHLQGKRTHYSICEGAPRFAYDVLKMLLETGLYFESELYVYTNQKMSEVDVCGNYSEFKDAGASLTVVTHKLNALPFTAVRITMDYLSQLAEKYIKPSGLFINGAIVEFNNKNFIRLIQSYKEVVNDITICFNEQGFLCVINFTLYKVLRSGIDPSDHTYDPSAGGIDLGAVASTQTEVKLLAFQDTAFLPSFENILFSMASQMQKAVFNPDMHYRLDYEMVPFNKSKTIQDTVENELSQKNPGVNRMSAFPLPTSVDTKVQYTQAVLYDGIVMIKSRTSSELALFRIFDALSGFIWLCVFASLVLVAIIFFAIKMISDHQTRAMGFVPDDDDVSFFKRFTTVIFHNFSAVFLAKVLVRPKQMSLRVLYQSYWVASILFVATYAASLAEQRFVARDSVVPFDSLRGLSETPGYRWIFLRNSSVVYKMQQSDDEVLTKLYNTAQKKWPKEMFAESVAEVSKLVENDDHLILIASRLEAKQILGDECQLTKTGPVEYLYALGYLLDGNETFVKQISDQINALNADHAFTTIETRTLGVGDCPLDSEAINMHQKPFSLRELGGLFIIVLIGLIIAFITAGIEFIVEKYPMYRQWKKGSAIKFGEAYSGEVLDVQNEGIWIRLLQHDTTAFVNSNHIKAPKGRRVDRLIAQPSLDDGRPNFQLGALVKATYLGNDPDTAEPLFSVTEEKTTKRDNNQYVNQ